MNKIISDEWGNREDAVQLIYDILSEIKNELKKHNENMEKIQEKYTETKWHKVNR